MTKHATKITADDELAALLSEDIDDQPETEDTKPDPQATAWDAYVPPAREDDPDGWLREAQRIEPTIDPDDVRGPGRNPNPRLRAQDALLNGLSYVDGHDWKVETFSRAWELPTTCRQCGDDLPLSGVDFDVCEFSTWPMDKCQCNPCLERRHKLKRGRGRPPVVCGSAACKRAEDRERKRRNKRVKAQAVAA